MSISKLLVENWRSFINEQDLSLGKELLQIIQDIEVVVIGDDGEPLRTLEFESAVVKKETGATAHIDQRGLKRRAPTANERISGEVSRRY
jgi:hypothetical protein